MQLKSAHRGFSFMKEGPLDMRMDPTQELSAKEIVNRWSERDLGDLIKTYGEEKRWRRAAKAIVMARAKRPIETTKQLADILISALKAPFRAKRHPGTLVFQALRLCVNGELDAIAQGLNKALHFLAPKGRIGVLSFHSLEDRIVKNIFREAASRVHGKQPFLRLLTKKPLVPSPKEKQHNPRARSAKLRFAERL